MSILRKILAGLIVAPVVVCLSPILLIMLPVAAINWAVEELFGPVEEEDHDFNW